MNTQLSGLCENYGLGTTQGAPQALSGGLMHRMYRVKTDRGVYCVKALNPEVMARPEALANMIRSENIASSLAGKVPLVAAKHFDGQAVVSQDGRYYMIFDFIEGRSIFSTGLSPKHCQAIGDLLGVIHKSDVKVPGVEPNQPDEELFNWDAYPQLAESKEKLTEWNRQSVCAAKQLMGRQVISHRDLDPKNVMWQGDKPFIIDWEAAGYVNPYQELAEVLSYWADDGKEGLDKDKFMALLTAYRRHMPTEGVEWEYVLAAGYGGMLGWLEYNIRRSMGLTGGDEQERALGSEQVTKTLGELYAYEAKTKQIKEWLKDESENS